MAEPLPSLADCSHGTSCAVSRYRPTGMASRLQLKRPGWGEAQGWFAPQNRLFAQVVVLARLVSSAVILLRRVLCSAGQ